MSPVSPLRSFTLLSFSCSFTLPLSYLYSLTGMHAIIFPIKSTAPLTAGRVKAFSLVISSLFINACNKTSLTGGVTCTSSALLFIGSPAIYFVNFSQKFIYSPSFRSPDISLLNCSMFFIPLRFK